MINELDLLNKVHIVFAESPRATHSRTTKAGKENIKEEEEEGKKVEKVEGLLSTKIFARVTVYRAYIYILRPWVK